MFRTFFLFELRSFLRGWMVWIFLFIIGLMLFGAASSDNIVVGGGLGNTNRNAPWVLQNFYAITSVLTLLMTTAFVNNAAIRDYRFNTNQMVFSLPISRQGYLWGRFLGTAFVSVIAALGVTLGVLAAPLAPWADADRFAAFPWHAHWNGLLTFAIPNTFFIAAILFGIAISFRSTTVSFISALLLLVFFGVTDSFSGDLKNESLAAMLDPFGARAYDLMTKYWTVAEKNSQSLHSPVSFCGIACFGWESAWPSSGAFPRGSAWPRRSPASPKPPRKRSPHSPSPAARFRSARRPGAATPSSPSCSDRFVSNSAGSSGTRSSS